jgi:hypothetical protein
MWKLVELDILGYKLIIIIIIILSLFAITIRFGFSFATRGRADDH